MNVRDAAIKKISENNEISDIKKIIGLESNRKYTSDSAKKCLRYGKVMFMTDQDLDGSHIKGLGINLFQSQWHDLIKLNDFLGRINFNCSTDFNGALSSFIIFKSFISCK